MAIDASLPPLRSTLTAKCYAAATLSAKLKPIESALSGLPARSGRIDATLPQMTAAAAGGVTRVKAVLPALAASVLARVSPQVVMRSTLPRLVVSISAQAAATATLGARLAPPKTRIAGLPGVAAALGARLPALIDSVFGSAGTIARLSVTISAPKASAKGFARVCGTIAVGLPRLRSALSVRLAVQQVLTQVTNLLTNSTVLYDQYPFNSFAEFGGRYLAAGPGGLYQIDCGDSDTSVPIAARFKSGESDFGSEFTKTVPYVYCAMRAQGDLTLRVIVDDHDPVDYVLSPQDVAAIKQYRTAFGKGLNGKYWAFEVSNTEGCDFDLDTMNLMAVPTRRRI